MVQYSAESPPVFREFFFKGVGPRIRASPEHETGNFFAVSRHPQGDEADEINEKFWSMIRHGLQRGCGVALHENLTSGFRKL